MDENVAAGAGKAKRVVLVMPPATEPHEKYTSDVPAGAAMRTVWWKPWPGRYETAEPFAVDVREVGEAPKLHEEASAPAVFQAARKDVAAAKAVCSCEGAAAAKPAARAKAAARIGSGGGR